MRPSLAVGIENSVAVNHLVVFVSQKREIVIAGKSVLELLNKFLGIFVTVDAYRQDLNLVFFLLAK